MNPTLLLSLDTALSTSTTMRRPAVGGIGHCFRYARIIHGFFVNNPG